MFKLGRLCEVCNGIGLGNAHSNVLAVSVSSCVADVKKAGTAHGLLELLGWLMKIS